ncbi:MAG: hypothetical protein H7336_06245 [Bacteriovorax sp.]|nr:hypothetical protein [Bacteriovorax sp.]
MRSLILSLFMACTSSAFALTLDDLQSGDVMAISFNCYECRMIESETDSSFSHSGVVVIDKDGHTKIGQSLGRLDLFSFADFTKKMTPGTKVSVFRPIEFINLSIQKRSELEKNMLDVFNEKYKNAPFDTKYLWNNFNAQGIELLYCSEFIAKFLDHFLTQKTAPLPISYKKNYDYWVTYFRGVVPDGELGNSPASFSRDSRFEFIGTL